ncbi:GNAT family N-acetyltransferase [Jiangella rhizosphaerae]|uniref:GNAT family N-acetyltransferase n=1 Tax=Jiangella rhizosphaerae TaxID=2293569 RepID=A0A418KQC2_9ACTN|nr:GNAT family N-acetyltransferase [Jiangella rhizosphaerae]RIQ22059.1 GNAT family N-acetyltransferase [Jiangella rhizosphaerae]
MSPSEPSPFTAVPANEAGWADLRTVLGSRASSSRCWCQRYKLRPRESFGSVPAEDRAERLLDESGCGVPDAERTTGLVGYLGAEPAGWCALQPRADYAGLRRVFRVPWEGRDEDPADRGVWALTCFVTRAGFGRRGVATALARAAAGVARERGARAVEGYPITTTRVIAEELHVGTVGMFAAAGFTEVSRPTPRRAVMRIDF